MDVVYDSIQHTQSITQKFFTIPSKTDPSILKVINEIKKRNNNKEFITAFVKQHGYPVWNKVLIGKNIKLRYENSFTNAVNDSSLIAYIPYVLEDSTKINGYIVASISDSITLGYRQASEYINHSFDAPVNGVSDATKFATVMMQLNQLVFGNSEYNITDRRLFGSILEHITINKIKFSTTTLGVSSQNFTDVEICSTIITSGWQCTTPNYHGCNDEDGCDHCGTYCTPIDVMTEVCWTFTVGDGGGETGTGTSPGGNAPPPSGSGGGGSGSGIPPADPCNNIPDNPTDPYTAQSNVVDPGNCPPPTGGPGWVPIEDDPPLFDPNNPCDVVDSLLKTTAFSVLLHKLRDSTINNYEIGYSQLNTLNPANYSETYYTGQFNSETLSVDVILNYATDGLAHNHYNSPDRLHNFSAEDIYKLAYYWSIGKINNLSTFSYTVVTDSTSYTLMIDDPAAFISFAQSWFDSKAHFYAFKTHLYTNHGYAKDGNSIAEDERTFLNALQAPPLNGAGLKLFRGNKEMNSFTPIKVSSTGQLVTNPCN